MKRFLLPLLISLIMSPVPSFGQTPRSAAEFYNRGLERQNSNDLDGAAADFQKAIDYSSYLLMRTSDGTQLTYVYINGKYRCTQVKDRNGNYITVNYNGSGNISYITDTLGRSITFN